MKFNAFSRHLSGTTLATGLFSIVATLLPCSLLAQDSSDEWQSRLTIYAWLPEIEAHTDFPTGGNTPPIGVDSETLVDNLEFAFMGALQVNKGSWGGYTDLIYLKENAVSTKTRDFTLGSAGIPVEVDTQAKYNLKASIWTVAGTYRLQDNQRNTSDVILGARLFDLEQKLDWTLTGGNLNLPGPSGSSRVSTTNWDAVIGLKGHYYLDADKHWVVPYYTDIGTGDSDLTWQAMAGIGYSFNWGTLLLTYRYLDYELPSDSNVSDFILNGPMLGASFKW